MQRFASDPALAQAMGAAARRRYEAHFTAGEMAREYRALYRELATASR